MRSNSLTRCGPVGAPAPQAPDLTPGDVWSALDALVRAQMESNRLLEAILAELRAERPQGIVYPLPLVITGGQWTPVGPFDPPFFALTIINDGPANADWRIPIQAPVAGIQIIPTEAIPIVFSRAVIDGIALRCTAGTANIRLIGLL